MRWDGAESDELSRENHSCLKTCETGLGEAVRWDGLRKVGLLVG